MNLKSRLEKLEQAGPVRLKDPKEMTDAELLTEIRRGRDWPDGYEPTDEELIEIIRGEHRAVD